MAMEKAKRKDLVREYRERKVRAGVFAVRAGNAVWAGSSRNLDAEKNRVFFMLKNGGYPNAAMREVWSKLGEQAFSFEVLEEVKDDNPLLIDALLKERSAAWRQKLGAKPAID